MNDDQRIVLKKGNMELEIAAGVGGSISRFGFFEEKEDGSKEFKPLLRTGPEKADTSNQLIAGDMGVHTGIPYINRTEPCTYEGKQIGSEKNHPSVEHRIHGDAWQEPWKVEKTGKDFAIMSYEHDGEKGFPFKYKATQKIKLSQDGLSIETEIINKEKHVSIPAGAGLHFYWTRTEKMKLEAKNPKLQFDVATDKPGAGERKTPADINFSKGKDVNDVHGLDANFTNPDGRFAIDYPEFDKKIVVKTNGNHDKNFLTVCVPDWTHALCAEPLTHSVYGISDVVKGTKTPEETGIKMLAPRESLKMRTLTVIRPLKRENEKTLDTAMLHKIANAKKQR